METKDISMADIQRDADWSFLVTFFICYIILLAIMKLCISIYIIYAEKSIRTEGDADRLIDWLFLLTVIVQDLYNIALLLAHIPLGISMMFAIYQNDYNLVCQEVNCQNTGMIPVVMRVYYILKFLQLGEILVHVVLLNYLLALLHRISMVFLAWYAINYVPGGSAIIWEMMDCLVYLSILIFELYMAETDIKGNRRRRLYVSFTVLFSLLLTFYDAILILVIKCGFPQKVALGVMVYIITLFVLKLLEPYYYWPPYKGKSLYFFWTIPFTALLGQLLRQEITLHDILDVILGRPRRPR